MRLIDRLPADCAAAALLCIRENADGFDRWPMDARPPAAWWCWCTVWLWRLVIVVDARQGTWHLVRRQPHKEGKG